MCSAGKLGLSLYYSDELKNIYAVKQAGMIVERTDKNGKYIRLNNEIRMHDVWCPKCRSSRYLVFNGEGMGRVAEGYAATCLICDIGFHLSEIVHISPPNKNYEASFRTINAFRDAFSCWCNGDTDVVCKKKLGLKDRSGAGKGWEIMTKETFFCDEFVYARRDNFAELRMKELEGFRIERKVKTKQIWLVKSIYEQFSEAFDYRVVADPIGWMVNIQTGDKAPIAKTCDNCTSIPAGWKRWTPEIGELVKIDVYVDRSTVHFSVRRYDHSMKGVAGLAPLEELIWIRDS